jgi:hypothetical protein
MPRSLLKNMIFGWHVLSVQTRIFSRGAFLTPCTWTKKIIFSKDFNRHKNCIFWWNYVLFGLNKMCKVHFHPFAVIISPFHAVGMQWGGQKFYLTTYARKVPDTALVSSCTGTDLQRSFPQERFTHCYHQPCKCHYKSPEVGHLGKLTKCYWPKT